MFRITNHGLKAQPPLSTERFIIRRPVLSDFNEWRSVRSRSFREIQPFEPTWAIDSLQPRGFKKRIQYYDMDRSDPLVLPLYIFSKDDNRMLGATTLSNFRTGVSQTCTLGYWVGTPYSGQGIVTEAVRRVLQLCFNDFRLNRVEASCQPQNIASRKVLKKCGFKYEGFARRYLKIDGVWRDHQLYALLKDEFDDGR